MTMPSSPAGDVDPAFPDVVDDAAPERSDTAEPQVAALPGDDYLGANKHGTTVQEQIEGASLELRLSQEEPEGDPYSSAAPTSDAEYDSENRLLSDPEGPYPGRLVEPDEGAHTDTDKEAIAREVWGNENDLSPEELAMHIEPETR